MPWTQVYNPTGSALLSTLLAAAPVVVLLGTLGLLGWSAPKAAAAGLVTALAVAIGVFGMPWQSAVAAAGYGACFGLFPIGWIVLAAVFLYVLTVEAGEFEIVKASVVALSPDRRIQALLDRVLLRRVHRRGGRIRHAGRDLGRALDRRRLPAAVCRRARADRQHGAGRVRRAGHADHHAGQSHRPARDAALGDGRAAAAALLADRAGLDGLHDVGLARLARRVAGGARLRRHVRRRAVPDFQLSRPVADRRRRRRGRRWPRSRCCCDSGKPREVVAICRCESPTQIRQ